MIASSTYDRYARLYEAEDKTHLAGITTGFTELDRLVTGLAPGDLVVLAARPGMGKTSFALDIAWQAAKMQQKTVAFYSLEMSTNSLMDRIVGGAMGLETWRLRRGEIAETDFGRLGTFFDEIADLPVFLNDDPDTSIATLRRNARRQQLNHGLELLIVDYLQLIEVPDRQAETRVQQVSYISRSLKNLARELQVPIIALSHLSRSFEHRIPQIPILADLRDSGTIEQDADMVWMLYREEAYHEDTDRPGVTDVFVRKNRNGPIGRIELPFHKERMSFR